MISCCRCTYRARAPFRRTDHGPFCFLGRILLLSQLSHLSSIHSRIRINTVPACCCAVIHRACLCAQSRQARYSLTRNKQSQRGLGATHGKSHRQRREQGLGHRQSPISVASLLPRILFGVYPFHPLLDCTPCRLSCIVSAASSFCQQRL